ncbi:MAG: cupin domain-containing protein, partial [Gammaproteobacteria bacterium]|nr:cupin domain-containing protein [Gammaproteobacteria bacterium]
MDRLSSLLELFRPKTRKVELLSGLNNRLDISADSAIGLVYKGSAILKDDNTTCINISQGDILWITAGNQFELISDQAGFELLCCQLEFGPVRLNPLFDMIPAALHLKDCEASQESLKPIIELLLQESLQQRCGQETVLNRLAEVLLVHVLRYVMKHQKIETGVLAGLADIRLARAITAIHSQPEQRWSVQ